MAAWIQRLLVSGIAAATLALIACSDRSAGGPDIAPTLSPLKTEGRILRDAQGREVILRGLNHIALRSNGSRPAYRVDGVTTPFEVLFDLQDVEDEDFDRIASFGFNFIRPVFTWEFAQPDPPPAPYNEAYFRLIDAFLDKAAAHGLYVVFNFGQFGWSRAAGGNAGAPDWAISDTCRGLPGPVGSAPPQLSVRVGCAFMDFWENEVVHGVGLQDAYIDLWREVMRRYRDHPAVVMVDLINEPYGGLIPPLLLETAYLYPFYRRAAAAIREIDADVVIGFQPELYHSLGIPVPATQAIGIDNAMFLPHNYTAAYFVQRVDPSYVPVVQDALNFADFLLTTEDARVYGTPMLVGETGWTRTTSVDGVEGPIDASDPAAPPSFARSLTQIANQLKFGWSWFAYSSTDPAYGIVLDDVVDAPLMQQLATPFPRAVGGDLDRIHFDSDTRRFELSVTGVTDAPIDLALPLAWQYPQGACVLIEGMAAFSVLPNGRLESPQESTATGWRYDPARARLSGARTPALLRITPLEAGDCA